MNLEELSMFRFNGSVSNILGEKKLNVEMKSINIAHNQSAFTPKTEKPFGNRRNERGIENRTLERLQN